MLERAHVGGPQPVYTYDAPFGFGARELFELDHSLYARLQRSKNEHVTCSGAFGQDMVPASIHDDRSALPGNVFDDGPRHLLKFRVIQPPWWKDTVGCCESAHPDEVDQLLDERGDPFVVGLYVRFR